MRNGVLCTLLVLAAISATGCRWRQNSQPDTQDLEPQQPSQAQLAGRAADLESENRTLRDTNRTLSERIEELKRRERNLADRVLKLRFTNDQLQRQIDVLATAPLERDRYKAQAEVLAARVNSLEKELAALKARVNQLATMSTLPTTLPAANE